MYLESLVTDERDKAGEDIVKEIDHILRERNPREELMEWTQSQNQESGVDGTKNKSRKLMEIGSVLVTRYYSLEVNPHLVITKNRRYLHLRMSRG